MMETTRRRRYGGFTAKILGLALTLVLIAAACAGSDGSAEETAGDASPSATNANDAVTTSSADAPADTTTTASSGTTEFVAVATVTIGGETINFRAEGIYATANCRPARDGLFRALLDPVDQNGEPLPNVGRNELDLVLLHEGTDPDQVGESNYVAVYLASDDPSNLNYTTGWTADAEDAERWGYDPALSQVNSYTIDGETASGTATFVTNESSAAFLRGDADTVESVQGIFSVNCRSE